MKWAEALGYVEDAVAQAVAEIEAARNGVPTILPELVQAGDWDVKPIADLQGRTNINDKEMLVPFGDSTLEAVVRLHEMGHAKWTDPDATHLLKSDFGPCLQVVEDMRIHHLLGETIGHWDLYGDATIDYVKQGYSNGEYPTERAETLMLEIASRQNGSGPILPLSPEDHAFVDMIQDAITSEPTQDMSINLAKLVYDYLTGEDEEEGEQESPQNDPNGEPSEGDSEDGESGDSEGTPMPETPDTDDSENTETADRASISIRKGVGNAPINVLSPRPQGPRYSAKDEFNNEVAWAPMELLEPERTRGIDRSKITRRAKKALKEGTVPRAISRVLTDGKVFTRKSPRERAGGAVLVDCSGSMSLTNDDVETLVTKAKHGTIAAYTGNYLRKMGWTVILAKNWMTVPSVRGAMPYMGGNNLVDGPAIRWLCTQPEPRVWISDGEVNGLISDGYAAESVDLTREVDALVKRYKITRYETITDYLDGNEAGDLRL